MGSNTSRNVAIASVIWGVSNLLSRIIGVVREAVIGRTLGGGVEADIYWSSFILPDFLNYLLAGGALSIVFIPIFSKYLSDDNEETGWKSFSYIANTLVLLLLVFIPLLWFVFPWIAPQVAPGFTEDQLSEVVRLTRIILPAQAFHLLGGILGAAQQAKNQHQYSATASLIYTIGIIIGGLVLGTADGFAYGVLLGSFFGPFLLNWIGAKKVGLRWSFAFSFEHADVRKYILLSLPIMIGASIIIWDDFFLKRYGSMHGEGAVSSLQYAKTLMKVPMGIFGLAYAQGFYPDLAKLVANKNDSGAYALLLSGTKKVLFLSLGAQVILSSVGADLARIIYGSRLLDGQPELIGQCLTFISIGLWGWSIQLILAKGFYAKGNTWTPTIIGTVMTLATAMIYSILGERYGVVGLAAASAVAVSIYVIVLEVFLRRFYGGQSGSVLMTVLKMGLSVTVCVLFGQWFTAIELMQSFPSLVRIGVVSSVVGVLYLLVINVWRIPEIRSAQEAVFGKVKAKLRL